MEWWTSYTACTGYPSGLDSCEATLTLFRLGEATDHFAQTEVEQLDLALKDAEIQSKTSADGTRATGESTQLSEMTILLSSVPGAGDLADQAHQLQAVSDAQQRDSTGAMPASDNGPAMQNIPGTNIDPIKTAKQIYPILEFRDKVVKIISATIEKIPGLEALVQKITDTLTLFILSLLAPFVRPIIDAVSKQLKAGSGGVIDASGKHQYEPWTDIHCSDPTHSLLSKDHFSNILNEPAGQVAASILQYVTPRVIYAWQHPNIPVEQVLDDVGQVFHHPAIRNPRSEVHQKMFSTVEKWARSRDDGGSNLNALLGSESVRQGKNHTIKESQAAHSLGGLPNFSSFFSPGKQSAMAGAPQIGRVREAPAMGPPGSGAGLADDIPNAFPGTQTEYDGSRIPAEAGAYGQQGPVEPSHYPGAQESRTQSPMQGWQQGPPAAPYPQPGYYPQPPQYGYTGASPYSRDSEAPPQQYGAPPPAPYYG